MVRRSPWIVLLLAAAAAAVILIYGAPPSPRGVPRLMRAERFTAANSTPLGFMVAQSATVAHLLEGR